MTTKTDWILASSSPRRREILTRLGLRPKVVPSMTPEPDLRPAESPSRYAIRVARLKVLEVVRRHGQGRVIGADTIVVVGGRILGKPESRNHARDMLHALSGRWHEVITGVCIHDLETRRSRAAACRSRVHVLRLSSAEIDWYIGTGEYRDKAGAYGIQGYASLFIDRIDGCYFNVVGFPVATFHQLCRNMGIRLF